MFNRLRETANDHCRALWVQYNLSPVLLPNKYVNKYNYYELNL